MEKKLPQALRLALGMGDDEDLHPFSLPLPEMVQKNGERCFLVMRHRSGKGSFHLQLEGLIRLHLEGKKVLTLRRSDGPPLKENRLKSIQRGEERIHREIGGFRGGGSSLLLQGLLVMLFN
jgi:hypothetical protein